MNLCRTFKIYSDQYHFPAVFVITSMLLVFFSPSDANAGRAKKLYEPVPILLDCSLGKKRVKYIIRSTIQDVEHDGANTPWIWGWGGYGGKKHGRGWVPTNIGKNLIEARLLIRKHTLVAYIRYDNKTVDITYHESENLNYSENSDGTRYLHDRANGWLRTLENDLRLELSRSCNNSDTVLHTGSRKKSSNSASGRNCSVKKIIQMKDIGMSDAQIEAACSK